MAKNNINNNININISNISRELAREEAWEEVKNLQWWVEARPTKTNIKNLDKALDYARSLSN